MKSWISRNWKKIIIIIGVICLVFILIGKIAAPKSLIEDYVKYGKNIESHHVIGEVIEKNVEAPSSIVSAEMVKMTIVFMVAILFVVFITSLGSKSSDKAKKK